MIPNCIHTKATDAEVPHHTPYEHGSPEAALFISLCIMISTLINVLTGHTVANWTFLTISIWFIGGLQMISLGIVGEYIGKIYSETKQRPRFIISENLNEGEK